MHAGGWTGLRGVAVDHVVVERAHVVLIEPGVAFVRTENVLGTEMLRSLGASLIKQGVCNRADLTLFKFKS